MNTYRGYDVCPPKYSNRSWNTFRVCLECVRLNTSQIPKVHCSKVHSREIPSITASFIEPLGFCHVPKGYFKNQSDALIAYQQGTMGDCSHLDRDVVCVLLQMMRSVSLEALKLSDWVANTIVWLKDTLLPIKHVYNYHHNWSQLKSNLLWLVQIEKRLPNAWMLPWKGWCLFQFYIMATLALMLSFELIEKCNCLTDSRSTLHDCHL